MHSARGGEDELSEGKYGEALRGALVSHRSTEFDLNWDDKQVLGMNVVNVIQQYIPASINFLSQKNEIKLARNLLDVLNNGFELNGTRYAFKNDARLIHAYFMYIRATAKLTNPQGELARRLNYLCQRLMAYYDAGAKAAITENTFLEAIGEMARTKMKSTSEPNPNDMLRKTYRTKFIYSDGYGFSGHLESAYTLLEDVLRLISEIPEAQRTWGDAYYSSSSYLRMACLKHQTNKMLDAISLFQNGVTALLVGLAKLKDTRQGPDEFSEALVLNFLSVSDDILEKLIDIFNPDHFNNFGAAFTWLMDVASEGQDEKVHQVVAAQQAKFSQLGDKAKLVSVATVPSTLFAPTTLLPATATVTSVGFEAKTEEAQQTGLHKSQ